MAEDDLPVSGGEQGDHILGLGLDIGPYIAQLKEALEAYNVFSQRFAKTLSVRLDASSLSTLSSAFGTQLRQAFSLIQGAQKETVQQSVENAQRIANEYGKIAGFGRKVFIRLKQDVRDVNDEAAKTGKAFGDAGKSGGEAFAEGIEAGVKRAQQEMREAAQESAQIQQHNIEAGQALSDRDFEKATRRFEQLERIARTRAAKEGISETRLRQRAQFPQDPTELTRKSASGKLVYDADAARAAIARLKSASNELRAELLGIENPLDRNAQQFENLRATLYRLRAEYDRLSATERRRFDELQTQRQAQVAHEPGVQTELGRTPFQEFSQPEHLGRYLGESEDGTKQFLNFSSKIAGIQLDMARARRESADAVKQEVRDLTKAAQEAAVIRRATTQREAIVARQQFLPESRRQPVPPVSELVTRDERGKLRVKDEDIAALNREIAREAKNHANTSQKLEAYDRALEQATRAAHQIDAQREKLARLGAPKPPAVRPTELVTPENKVDTAQIDALKRANADLISARQAEIRQSEAYREAERQREALLARQKFLPEPRRQPVPAAEELVRVDEAGTPKVDRTLIARLNEAISTEAKNHQNASAQLEAYDRAIAQATRAAQKLDEKQAKLAALQPKPQPDTAEIRHSEALREAEREQEALLTRARVLPEPVRPAIPAAEELVHPETQTVDKAKVAALNDAITREARNHDEVSAQLDALDRSLKLASQSANTLNRKQAELAALGGPKQPTVKPTALVTPEREFDTAKAETLDRTITQLISARQAEIRQSEAYREAERQRQILVARNAVLPTPAQKPIPQPQELLETAKPVPTVDTVKINELNAAITREARNHEEVSAALDTLDRSIGVAARQLETQPKQVKPTELITAQNKFDTGKYAQLDKALSDLIAARQAEARQSEVLREAERQRAAIIARQQVLPEARREVIPPAQELIRTTEEGVPQVDKAKIGQLNEAISREAKNTATTNEALEQYDRALRTATRVAQQLNAKQARLAETGGPKQEPVEPKALIGAQNTVDANKVAALNKTISDLTAARQAEIKASEVLRDAEKQRAALIAKQQFLPESRRQVIPAAPELVRKTEAGVPQIDRLKISQLNEAIGREATNHRNASARIEEYERALRQATKAAQQINAKQAEFARVTGKPAPAPVEPKSLITPQLKLDTEKVQQLLPPKYPSLRPQITEANELLKTHRGIGLSVSQQAGNLVKWLFFYRAVHDVTRLIETSIRSFVGAGVEYTREQETQLLAIRGILRENFKVEDAQKRQLTGAAALNALQRTAETQWKQIQQASLSVVGTTADLLGLYAGVLPFAAKLGADLNTIQKLTQSTAVAASLLDVSFQDARTALVALLQGRTLTRNRLVGALGFSKDEVDNLKKSGDLIGGIQRRLDAFLALSGEAQQTLAALSESFKDFTGIVASGITKPFTDLFKQMVIAISGGNKELALFNKTAAGFQIAPGLQAFLDFTSRAITEALEPLKKFGRELVNQSQNDLKKWVIALKEGVEWTIAFAAAFVKLLTAVATFVAQNRTLIEFFAKWVVAGTIVANVAYNIGIRFINAGTAALRFLGVLRQLASANIVVTSLENINGQTVAVEKTMTRGAYAAKVFSTALSAIGKAFAVGLVISGIFEIVSNLARVKQEADEARKTILALGKADVQGVIQHAQEGLGSPEPRRRAEAARAEAEVGRITLRELQQALPGTSIDVRGQTAARAKEISDSVTAATKLYEQRLGLQQQQTSLSQKATEAKETGNKEAEARFTKQLDAVSAKIAAITGQYDALTKRISDLKTEQEKPEKLARDVDDVLAQERSVLDSLAKFEAEGRKFSLEHFPLSGAGANEIFTKLKGLFGDEFDINKVRATTPLRPGEEPGFIDASAVARYVRQAFADLRKGRVELEPKLEAARQGQEPILTPVKPEKAPIEEDYHQEADNRIAIAEAEAKKETSIVELAVAQRKKFEDDGAEEIERIQEDLLRKKLYFYKQDEEAFKKYRASLDPDKAKEKKQSLDSTQEGFARKVIEAQVELDVAQVQREKNALARTQKALDALEDASRQFARFEADIYGTTEESAAASFDKTVTDIRQKLEKLGNVSPEIKVKVTQQLEAFQQQRPEFIAAARDKSIVASSTKELETARNLEALITKQFETGTVSAEVFLKRIREIRQEQIHVLQDQADALERQAERIQKGLDIKTATANAAQAVGIVGVEIDPEQFRASTAAIAALRAQIEGVKQEIADIESLARRVEAALQAWNNVASRLRDVLSIADFLDDDTAAVDRLNEAQKRAIGGFGVGISDITRGLKGMLNLLDQIVSTAFNISRLPKAFSQLTTLFKDAKGGGGLLTSVKALGSLIGSAFKAPQQPQGGISKIAAGATVALPALKLAAVDTGKITQATAGVMTAGQKFAQAIPLIGIGVGAAFAIANIFFQRAVEKARKDIQKRFSDISKAFESGAITLGDSIGQLEKERARIIAQYSKSKSGRKALKELLPQIDDTIDQAKRQAKQIQESFIDAFKQAVDFGGHTVGSGPFADFYRSLLDLERSIKEYLDSFDRSTREGMEAYKNALMNVQQYTSAFFENAKRQFESDMMGFESEALAAQERVFSLINERDGLYTQLRDIGEQRLDLDEAIADEQERRMKAQDKLNDLAQKELDLRKQIADVMRQANEDELAIRRRGVLEAQLTIAQQKAIEISQVRNKAADEIERLKRELADLKNDIEDETQANARKDRDFERQKRNLAEREEEIRKALRLNEIRLRGAQAVAAIEGEQFGMAQDEFQLAEMQNDLAVRQAQAAVERWRETAALINAIVENADKFFFEPPPGFPQIKVELGSITIDNRDYSNVSVGGGTGGGGGGGGNGDGTKPGPGRPPRGGRDENNLDSYGYDIGEDARGRGYGDVV